LRYYVVTGHPLGLSAPEIDNKGVGREFAMDMDPIVEKRLITAGAIRFLGELGKPKSAPTKEEH
jgi:hypothetical protein